MHHSATKKSHPFLDTSGSNKVITFGNKMKNTEKNVFRKCKNKFRLML